MWVPTCLLTSMVAVAAASGPDTSGIDAARNAYVAAWRAANADRIALLYDEKAWVLYPNQPGISGRAAIRAYFKEFFTAFAQEDFQLTSDEIEIAGPWAFDRGAYRWKGVPRAGGLPVEDHGKYLVVLRRQADGSWKVARDMDNSDRPLAQSAREAAPGPESTALEQKAAAEIRAIEEEWAATAVSGDVSVIERILADDFVGTTPEGVRYTKREFIGDMKAHPSEFSANHVNDVQVHFFGGVAVAQGDETFTRRGGERARFVWTDVLVRRDGRWQIVAAEDLIAPEGARQPKEGLFGTAPSPSPGPPH